MAANRATYWRDDVVEGVSEGAGERVAVGLVAALRVDVVHEELILGVRAAGADDRRDDAAAELVLAEQERGLGQLDLIAAALDAIDATKWRSGSKNTRPSEG